MSAGKTTLCLLLALVLSAAATARAQERPAELKVGAHVVLNAPDTPLRVGERIVARDKVHHVYRVENVDGDWLWLVAGPIAGWARRSEAVAPETAIATYTDILLRQPKAAWAYLARGVLWDDRHEPEIALADYDEAIRLDPTLAAAFNNRGALWAARRDFVRALADLNEAIRLVPGFAELIANRAAMWRDVGDYARALDDDAAALRLKPDLPVALHHRAWIMAACPLAQYRDGPRAVAEATRACQLTGYRHPHFVNTLAAAYAEAGDFASAVRWQAKAAELLPSDSKDVVAFHDRLALYRANRPYRMEPKGRVK